MRHWSLRSKMTDELYSALKEGALGKLRPRPAGSCALKRRAGGFTLLELLVVVTIIASLAALVVGTFDSAGEQAELVVARANLSTVREAISGSASAPGYLADMKHVPGFNRLAMRTRDLLSDDFDLDGIPDVENYSVTTNRGWRGPYVQRFSGVQNTNAERAGRFPEETEVRFIGDKTFQARRFFDSEFKGNDVTGDLAVGDQWGNPIILQVPPESAFFVNTSDQPRLNAKRWRYARIVSAGPDGELQTQGDDRLAEMQNNGTSDARGDDLVLFLNRPDVYEPEEN